MLLLHWMDTTTCVRTLYTVVVAVFNISAVSCCGCLGRGWLFREYVLGWGKQITMYIYISIYILLNCILLFLIVYEINKINIIITYPISLVLKLYEINKMNSIITHHHSAYFV